MCISTVTNKWRLLASFGAMQSIERACEKSHKTGSNDSAVSMPDKAKTHLKTPRAGGASHLKKSKGGSHLRQCGPHEIHPYLPTRYCPDAHRSEQSSSFCACDPRHSPLSRTTLVRNSLKVPSAHALAFASHVLPHIDQQGSTASPRCRLRN